MCTHRAANRLNIGQRNAGVTEARRLFHQFLGMTRAPEKGVITLNNEFAPRTRRRSRR